MSQENFKKRLLRKIILNRKLLFFIPHKIKSAIRNREYSKMVLLSNRIFEDKTYPCGINFIGHFLASTGIGEGIRMYSRPFIRSEMPHDYIDIPLLLESKKETEFEYFVTTEIKYNINVIHINPNQLYLLSYKYSSEYVFNHRYNIGVWAWELEDIPLEWHKYLSMFDEFWVPSHFIKNALEKVTNKKVLVMPYSLKRPQIDSTIDCSDFQIFNNRFLYLCMFDSVSSTLRKNPFSVILSFRGAFKFDDSTVGLVVKINHGNEKDVKEIKKLVGEHNNIFIVNETFTKDKLYRLIDLCNVLISLHRSEGFGIPIAEAMLLEKAVIVTGYSGNSDYTNNDNACLVPYKLISVSKKYTLNTNKNSVWADADIKEAATLIRKVYEEVTYRKNIASKARIFMESAYSSEKTHECISKRYFEIVKLLEK